MNDKLPQLEVIRIPSLKVLFDDSNGLSCVDDLYGYTLKELNIIVFRVAGESFCNGFSTYKTKIVVFLVTPCKQLV